MLEKPVTVLLADDHAIVREGLAALLGNAPGFSVVGQCGDGLRVADMVSQLQPDLVLLDISLPGMNGLDVCRELHRKWPQLGVLILTMHDDAEFAAKAMAYGASGYLRKEAAAEELHKAIASIRAGKVYISPDISDALLQRVSREEPDLYETLTTRERQVLHLIAEGKTNRQLAGVLGLSIKTVDTHRSHLMRKLDIHDQTALVKYALKKGIVSLG